MLVPVKIMTNEQLIGSTVKITTVCTEAGDYAKAKQGLTGLVVDVDPIYIYVDFEDGNDGWESGNKISGYPILEGEFEVVNLNDA